jgi:hypothetical protein
MVVAVVHSCNFRLTAVLVVVGLTLLQVTQLWVQETIMSPLALLELLA